MATLTFRKKERQKKREQGIKFIFWTFAKQIKLLLNKFICQRYLNKYQIPEITDNTFQLNTT